jgi:hypothetical protein
MNNYSLKSEGNRWWWSSAAAGAVSAAAIAAIVALPAASGSVPADPTRGGYVAPAAPTERPCYMYRISSTGGWDGFQPTCPLDTDTHEPAPAPDTGRPGLDYGP